VKEVIMSQLDDQVFDVEIRVINSWQENGIIKDMRSAIIGCLFWKSMESVMKVGYKLNMNPLEMRILYNELFIEFIAEANDKIMDRLEKVLGKPHDFAV
jgi:hypothetical protein